MSQGFWALLRLDESKLPSTFAHTLALTGLGWAICAWYLGAFGGMAGWQGLAEESWWQGDSVHNFRMGFLNIVHFGNKTKWMYRCVVIFVGWFDQMECLGWVLGWRLLSQQLEGILWWSVGQEMLKRFHIQKVSDKKSCLVQYHDISTPSNKVCTCWHRCIFLRWSHLCFRYFFWTRLSWDFFPWTPQVVSVCMATLLRWAVYCITWWDASVVTRRKVELSWWRAPGVKGAFLGGWDPNLVRATLTYSLYNPYRSG